MYVRVLTIAFVSLTSVVAQPSVRAEPEAELGWRVEQLIVQLDDDSFGIRESAQRQLFEIGEPAADAVRAATHDESPEVRVRARAILRQMLGPGLVLYLPMDGQTRGLRRHADVKVAHDRNEKEGQAMQFSGKGFLVVPDAERLDTDDAFTLAAWIKPAEFVYVRLDEFKDRGDEPTYPWGEALARWDGHFIVAKWLSEGSHGDYLFAVTPSGQLGLGVSHYRSGYRWDAVHTDRILKLKEWSHVSATFDGGAMKLYINGQLEAERQSTTIPHTNRREYDKDDIYIGALWNNQYNFHGAIDEVCIYNRALKGDEIQLVRKLTR